MTQGQSLLYPDVAPISLERLGAAQRARALALSARTIIAVPLTLAGKTVGVLSLCATDRHYRSEDLTLAEEVAERVAVAFENARLYEVAQRAIHARDEFLVLAAHELRTPLTALQLLALDQRRKTSRGAGPDPTVRAEALCRQVKRLVSLVEHMLEAVRIRADGVSLEVEACDLATIVGGRVAAAEERARREGCALTVRSESCVEGRWDRVRVAQVFDELLGNALKFGAGKPIEIAVDSDQGQALLAVRDHGVGIPADSLTAIFSPFERAVSREHFGGLGLGLFIARAVVEAHGGSIEVTSRPERETTFVVRLPMESAPLR
jgi:signal transduction histidine kinase